MNSAATKSRTFHTFLLMSQLQAREIGGRIKQKRLERGMTQDELAALTSFSARSLQDYENGVTIPYRHFREIGRLLDTSPEWLMYGRVEASEAEPVQESIRGLLEGIGSALVELAGGQKEILSLLETAAQRGEEKPRPRRAAPKR